VPKSPIASARIKCIAVFLALSCIGLTGCTYSYTKDVTHSLLQQAGWGDGVASARTQGFTLPTGTSMYIVYPRSSPKLERKVPRFSTKLQEALLEAAQSRGLKGIVGDYQQGVDEALDDARVYDSDFLLSVTVTDLESGTKPRKHNDGFELHLTLYDVRSQRLLDTLTISTKRGLSPAERSNDALIYTSANAVLDRLYTPPQG
jgi:hypothetical protein